MKKNGFTLIELMVVITLIMLLAGFTSADYLKFRDRLVLEGAAKDVASTLELANKYARTGNRGDGSNCGLTSNGGNVTQEDILNQTKPLLYWAVRSTDGTTLETYVCCGQTYTDCLNNPTQFVDVFDDKKITLPPQIKIKDPAVFDFKFRSLWGGTMKLDASGTNDVDLTDPESIHLQAFDDDFDPKTNYYFLLGEEGWTTSGCFKDGLVSEAEPKFGCQ